MVKCSVMRCRNYSTTKNIDSRLKKVRYFIFPKQEELKRKWMSVCNKPVNSKSARICSDHFTESYFKLEDILLNIPLLKRTLKKDAVPTLNLASTESDMNKKFANEC